MGELELDTVGLTDLEASIRRLVSVWTPAAACAMPASLPFDGAMLAEAIARMLQFDAEVRSRLAHESNLLAELCAHVVETADVADVFRGLDGGNRGLGPR